MSLCLVICLGSGCAIREGRRIPEETVIAHGNNEEMRVWGCTNAFVSALPKDPFVSECFAPLAVIVAIPGVVLDAVFFPFKWIYGEITLTEDLDADEIPTR